MKGECFSVLCQVAQRKGKQNLFCLSLDQTTKHVAYAKVPNSTRLQWQDNFIICKNLFLLLRHFSLRAVVISAIKKRMEKDIDEVGKIARNVKGKLEAVNKDVILDLLQNFPNLFLLLCCWSFHNCLKNICILMHSSSLQNLTNRQKPGCEKGTAIDRARMNVTKFAANKHFTLKCLFWIDNVPYGWIIFWMAVPWQKS